MKLVPRRFRTKLLLTMVVLVLFVELTTIAAVLRTTYRDTVAQAHARLASGVEVMYQTLAESRAQLLERVEVLAADFGFRSALATGEASTIASVLANQAGRAGADQVLLLAPDGAIQIALPDRTASADSGMFKALLAEAERNGRATVRAVRAGGAYQFVMVPVSAPELIGWVVMGFELDNELASVLSRVTGLEVLFSIQQNGRELSRVSTLDRDEQWRFPVDRLPEQPEGGRSTTTLVEDGVILATTPLSTPSGTQASGRIYGAVLLEESEVLRAHGELRRDLIVIFGLTLLFSVLAAFGLARAIGKPLMQLAQFARTIGGGGSAKAPRIRDRGELGLLARTLENMQNAIRAREARILHQSRHDQLTGLPNREAAESYLAEQIAQNRPCLVLRIALRGFKEINESLGYAFGDQILKAAALRIRAATSGGDRVFRVGGNEFLSVMNCEPASPDITALEVRFRERVERPIDLMESPVTLRIDLGIIALPEQAATVEQVLRRSAIALDRSGTASGRTAVYEAGEDEVHLRELTLTRDLQRSLAAGQMRLVFQPQITMRPAQVIQFEALLRWQHPELGFVPPDEFILLAERSGQVGFLTEWVIKAALAQIQQFRKDGFSQAVSINLSAHDLADAGLAGRILDQIAQRGLPPDVLTVEVTESALMEDPQQAVASLSALEAGGIDVAIDDFGTGYSSLAQLKRLPVGELKIDKAFVLNLASNHEDQMIVRSTIGLAHTLGLRVVAEGVEDLKSWQLLRGFGCDRGQGYLLAKPMEADAVIPWLRQFPEQLEADLNAAPERDAQARHDPEVK